MAEIIISQMNFSFFFLQNAEILLNYVGSWQTIIFKDDIDFIEGSQQYFF